MFTLRHSTSNHGAGRIVHTFKDFDAADRMARDMYMKAVEGTMRSVKSSGPGCYTVHEWDGKIAHILRVTEV